MYEPKYIDAYYRETLQACMLCRSDTAACIAYNLYLFRSCNFCQTK